MQEDIYTGNNHNANQKSVFESENDYIVMRNDKFLSNETMLETKTNEDNLEEVQELIEVVKNEVVDEENVQNIGDKVCERRENFISCSNYAENIKQEFPDEDISDENVSNTSESVLVQRETGVDPLEIEQTPSSFMIIITVTSNVQNNNENSKQATETVKEEYKCEYCSKIFLRKNQLKKHVLIHTGEKSYKCDVCSKQFGRLDVLKTHKLTHSTDKPYKCDVCFASFARTKYLKRHKIVHSGEKPFECKICVKRFSSAPGLKKHQVVHTGEKLYKCELCPRRFTSHTSLKIHKYAHTGEKLFKCEVCEKNLSNSGALAIHMRRHTGEKPFACHLCPMAFVAKEPLKAHVKKHTNGRILKCDVCLKNFYNPKNLKRHLTTHTKETFKCERCNEIFSNVAFSRHEKICAGEKTVEVVVGNVVKVEESVFGGEENVNLDNRQGSIDEKDPLEVTGSNVEVKREKIDEIETFNSDDGILVCKDEYALENRWSESKEPYDTIINKNNSTICSAPNNIGNYFF